jgi:hypothetical protein
MAQDVNSIKTALFEMLDNLSDPELKGAELCSMIERSGAIVNVVSQINSTADMVFKAAKLMHDVNPKDPQISAVLQGAVGVTDGSVKAIGKK